MLNLTTSVARRHSLSRSPVRGRGLASFSESIISRPAIVMPAMSPFLTEGAVSRWRKKEGESFVAGEAIVQIECDIAMIDIVAESPGILGQILIPDGTRNVPVQQVMATVARNAEELAVLMRRRAVQYNAPPVRTPSPTPATRRVERPLLSAMDHRPTSSETHSQQSLNVARGLATKPMSARSAPPPPPKAVQEGANLRRKIVASMAQSSRYSSNSKEYFEGLI